MANNSLLDLTDINPSPLSPFKIYIACLTSRLEGKHHGDWVDANQSVEALKKAAQDILAASPAGTKARNWVITAGEGFGPLFIDSFTSFVIISRLAAFLTTHGKLGAMLVRYFDEDLTLVTLEKAQCLMARGHHGVHPSKLAFVESFFPIALPLSSRIEPYRIHKLITHHLFASYFFTLKVSGQLHVFSRYKTLDQFESRPLD